MERIVKEKRRAFPAIRVRIKFVIVFNSSDVYRVREASKVRVPGFIPSVMKSHGITE
jgi:hypothetical protein